MQFKSIAALMLGMTALGLTSPVAVRGERVTGRPLRLVGLAAYPA